LYTNIIFVISQPLLLANLLTYFVSTVLFAVYRCYVHLTSSWKRHYCSEFQLRLIQWFWFVFCIRFFIFFTWLSNQNFRFYY